MPLHKPPLQNGLVSCHNTHFFCTFLSYHYIPTDCHNAVAHKGMDSSNTRINLGQFLPGGTVYIH